MEKDKSKFLIETLNYSEEDAKFMMMAIKLSEDNIDTGGGPFGAVIVQDGKVIATGTNRVVPNADPTAHAEVMAIRNACAALGTFQLKGCTVYSSCEPCPMCLSALYWAGVAGFVTATPRTMRRRLTLMTLSYMTSWNSIMKTVRSNASISCVQMH